MVVTGGARHESGLTIDLACPCNELFIELTEDELVGTEGVGLDGIGAGSEKFLMNALHQLGT